MSDKARQYDIGECLRDIRDSARLIEEYVDEISEDSFLKDIKCQDAVIRRFEIMGEAARRIMVTDQDWQRSFPGIDLRIIYATRNRFSHGYDSVNTFLVWETATQDVPKLRYKLDQFIARL